MNRQAPHGRRRESGAPQAGDPAPLACRTAKRDVKCPKIDRLRLIFCRFACAIDRNGLSLFDWPDRLPGTHSALPNYRANNHANQLG